MALIGPGLDLSREWGHGPIAARPGAGHRASEPDRKEAVEMTRIRRAIAWLIISVVILSLVATMVVGGAE
jgi:hypothetical protein